MLQRSIGEEIDFRCELAPDLGWARVDPAQLEHVLVNLALNARDAMPEGGVLTIATRNVEVSIDLEDSLSGPAPGEYIEVAVRDTGTGMDAETRRQIFDPFYTTKEVGKGSGLGLATVYGVVRQSGGTVSVDSAPGEGTVVRVFLPRVPAPIDEPGLVDQDVALPVGKPGFDRLRGSTVLVVEDDERIRGLLDSVLKDNGYDVIVARNGVEALELSARNGIDLLLTDVVMPELGGPELADRMAERNPELHVIFMSGYSEEILSSRLGGPARMLLEKPFSLPDLLDSVRASLEA
jgi:two-component system cell cycle sensor histidine kinase/response regulator CckA